MTTNIGYTRNPDEDFILHGLPTKHGSRSITRSTNSQQTNTTKGLSQVKYNAVPSYSNMSHHSLSNYARHLDDVSRNIDTTLSKSISFVKDNPSASRLHLSDSDREVLLRNSYISIDDACEAQQDHEGEFSGRPALPNESSWYTHPSHHSTMAFPSLIKKGYSMKSLYPSDRAPGTIGAKIAADKLARSRVISGRELDEISRQMSIRDALALSYFPVTLNRSYTAEQLEEVPDYIDLKKRRPVTAGRQRKAEALFLLTSESPATASAGISFTSPYVDEMAKLRMERLRIEEDRLLEMKRHLERERTRGPRARWYESKGLDFHYEHHKNTDLIKSGTQLENMLSYREELDKSSMDCSKLYNKSLVF